MQITYGYYVYDAGATHVFESEHDLKEYMEFFGIEEDGLSQVKRCTIHHFDALHGELRDHVRGM